MVGPAGEASKALGRRTRAKNLKRRPTRAWVWSTSVFGSWLVKGNRRGRTQRLAGTAAVSRLFISVRRRSAQNLATWAHPRSLRWPFARRRLSAAESANAVAGFATRSKTRRASKEFRRTALTSSTRAADSSRSATSLNRRPPAVERGGENALLEFKKMFANVKGAQSADPAFQAYVKAFPSAMTVTKDSRPRRIRRARQPR